MRVKELERLIVIPGCVIAPERIIEVPGGPRRAPRGIPGGPRELPGGVSRHMGAPWVMESPPEGPRELPRRGLRRKTLNSLSKNDVF